jgi:hypothetical protein
MSITPFHPDSYRDFPHGGRSNKAFPPWRKMKGGAMGKMELSYNSNLNYDLEKGIY